MDYLGGEGERGKTKGCHKRSIRNQFHGVKVRRRGSWRLKKSKKVAKAGVKSLLS